MGVFLIGTATCLSFADQHPGKRVGETIELEGLPQVLWPDPSGSHLSRAAAGGFISPNPSCTARFGEIYFYVNSHIWRFTHNLAK